MKFTSKSLRRFLSKKAKKSRRLKQKIQRKRTRRIRKSQRGGGDTNDRSIPKKAVIVNPINWTDGEEKDPLV
jgi:hypothetical protein